MIQTWLARIGVCVLACAVCFGVGYWRAHEASKADVAAAQSQVTSLRTQYTQAQKDLQDQATALTSEHVADEAAIAAAYTQGQTDAKADGAKLLADLRSGTVRLRSEWRVCESVGALPDVATAAAIAHATEQRREDIARAVSVGAAADAQIRGLQAVVIDDRRTVSAGAAQQK